MILLVVLNIFRWCALGFLLPGHSHEDVDQVFGQISGFLGHSEFSTPGELQDLLDSATRPEGAGSALEKQASKNIRRQADAYKLDVCADWKSWTARLGIVLKGLRTPNVL